MISKKLCLGSANFGERYGLNNKSPIAKKDLDKIFKFLKSKKYIFIDTAINYKNSEIIIGKYSDKKFRIISKLPKIPKKILDIDNWILQRAKNSCERLKVKKLYGLLIHDTNDLRNKKKSKKIYQALNNLKNKNIVEKIGLSIYDPKELSLFINDYDFKIVQSPLNIFDRRIIDSGWLKKLKKKGIEFHARSIFLQGLLVKDIDKIDKFFKSFKKRFIKFENWTKKIKISKVEACLRFVNSIKGVDKIIIGNNNEKQFINNYSILKKPKLYAPNILKIRYGKILNPKFWKI